MNKHVNKTIIITSYLDYDFDMAIEVKKDDFVICTDGGYDIALSHGITPSLILGDFDSVSNDLPMDIPIVRFNPEKDFTDLELAVKTAAEKNSHHVEIWGGIGGRLDHTIANIQILSGYCTAFETLILKDGHNSCLVLKGDGTNHTIEKKNSKYFSLFSLTEKCIGLTVENVKYPLENHTLTNTFPLGVSNEITKEKAVLSFEDGLLLVILSSE